MGLCPSPKPGRIFWEVRWDKRSSHLTPNQIQRLSDLQGLRGFHDGMKAGKAKPHHPEILTWGRRCARRWRGEAAPLPGKLTQLFSSPPPPPRKGMLLPTPRKPLPPNPQGSGRPPRRPGAEERRQKIPA